MYQDTQVKIREGERRENPQAEKTADKKPARGQARNFVLFSYRTMKGGTTTEILQHG